MSNAKKSNLQQTFDYPEKNPVLLITEDQLWTLSYYRSSELTGSLLMGKYARIVKDDELRSRLTWHFAEEARHAWRWTELIRKMGADPLPIKDTYQSNYFSAVGVPDSDFDVIAITQIFEKRIASHLTLHQQDRGTHAEIKKLLQIMINDEGPHLNWGAVDLKGYLMSDKKDEYAQKIELYKRIDAEVYKKETRKFVDHGWTLPEGVLHELKNN